MRAVAAGFTLIEVLVAVFVLAVGIVGAAGTQLVALRTRQQSALMSDAVQLASDFADRMRANARVDSYLQTRYDAASDGAPSPPSPICDANAACGNAELARFDIYELEQALHARFPGGRVVVCRDASSTAVAWACSAAAGAPVVIKLGWRGKEPDGAPVQEPVPSVAIALAEVE